jgi:glycosyltransferase involved in cell wall biosynthesis
VSHKGVDTLLRAVAETPEVIATIAGTGELEGQLRELANELGCASRVNFAGWSDPVSVLRTVDAVVLPSRDEGLPLAMLEAMRAGFPVIATSVGSVTEALEDGVTGLVIPPEDHVALVRSLRRFAASPSLREQLGIAAKARGEAFSVEAMAGAYQQVYVAALTRRRRQSQLSSR